MSTVRDAVIWLSFGYHALVGVLAILSTKLVRRIGSRLYALSMPAELDPRHEYTLKPLGAYALLLAALCLRALLIDDPAYKDFIAYALAATYAARACLRVVYYDLFFRAFGVGRGRNAVNVGFNFVLTSLLLWTTCH